jgi:hypothetical protein
MAEDFQLNILKLICAELYFLAGLNASREMYGKSYYALGVGEKAAVDQAVWSQISGNLATITPALFAQPTPVPTTEAPPEKKNGHAK